MATNVTTPAPVTVGTAAVQVTFSNMTLLKGVLLLQRAADAGAVYVGATSGVTTSTGVLIAKGAPGQVAPSLLPRELFLPGASYANGVWLISGTASQTVDVTPV